MIRVSIVGASGYSGVYLIQALSLRPDVSMSVITSNSNAGKKLSDFFPLFAKANHKNPLLSEIKFSLFDADLIGGSSDAVFFCLPHNESSKLIPAALNKNKDVKIIDVGADFRFDDVSVYERHYGKHSAPELKETLAKASMLTRDPRVKERKKYGQKAARARFQFSKR